jgi:hypothetical protein
MVFGAAPCEGCLLKPECKAHRLACADFAHFVEYGKTRLKDRDATGEAFRKLFGG